MIGQYLTSLAPIGRAARDCASYIILRLDSASFCFHSDLNLDTKLELLRTRDYMEYAFHSHPTYRDGKYRGQWRDAKPHGK